jgi:hypothetical protein
MILMIQIWSGTMVMRSRKRPTAIFRIDVDIV